MKLISVHFLIAAYMAPEVFMKSNTEGHGRAVDIWSTGCVVIEMASGKVNYLFFKIILQASLIIYKKSVRTVF
jgi:serine/threonine protein kinase